MFDNCDGGSDGEQPRYLPGYTAEQQFGDSADWQRKRDAK